MKLIRKLLLYIGVVCSAISCAQTKNKNSDFISDNIQFAAKQEQLQLERCMQSSNLLNPRTWDNGNLVGVGTSDWTCGFFSGTLWYLYELTGDTVWLDSARKFTQSIDTCNYQVWSHDIGFVIQCSYGNGLRLGEKEYKRVIIQAAKALSSRFRPQAGVIQSWDVDKGWMSTRGWECPVIIDNMMNLELLFNATKLSGDSTFYKIALSHADKTLNNHFRPNFSSYHVVDYSLSDGRVRSRQTAQGYADESAWARGQAWGIYGFTVCYRETQDPKYLSIAESAFEFVIHHKNFPPDAIPYWDLDAPGIPDEPRDASSAAVLASALYEISTYDKPDYYKNWADKIMQSLASENYRSNLGENGDFLLKHSVGSIPHGQEIDVPLNYADYYFLEALKRKRDIER